ncbi:unnamed protein product, partial [Ectocarpus sp. 8 AP-2014]
PTPNLSSFLGQLSTVLSASNPTLPSLPALLQLRPCSPPVRHKYEEYDHAHQPLPSLPRRQQRRPVLPVTDLNPCLPPLIQYLRRSMTWRRPCRSKYTCCGHDRLRHGRHRCPPAGSHRTKETETG